MSDAYVREQLRLMGDSADKLLDLCEQIGLDPQVAEIALLCAAASLDRNYRHFLEGCEMAWSEVEAWKKNKEVAH